MRGKIVYLLMAVVLAGVPALSARAATTVGTNVSTGGTLTSSGLATLSAGFVSVASSTVSENLTVHGAMGASSTLLVDGAATLSSTLAVTSLATLTGGFISSASSTVVGPLHFRGHLSVSSTMSWSGDVSLATHNTVDIGAFGTALGNVYSSSTLFSASSTVYNSSDTSTLYVSSAGATKGGQIVLKSSDGSCYAIYMSRTIGALGPQVTSTVLAGCY